MNISRYGNTSAASIGLCLDEAFRAGRIAKGDYVLLTAFGGRPDLGSHAAQVLTVPRFRSPLRKNGDGEFGPAGIACDG